MEMLIEEPSQEYWDAEFKRLEVYLEYDGFHCERCHERLETSGIPDETHDCIECAECGEYDMCICKDVHFPLTNPVGT